MIRFSWITAVLSAMMLLSLFSSAAAQSNDFRIANQYMQQQNYEQALPILMELHRENPSAYTFFDRLTETLINLKRYDEAIEIANSTIANGHNVTRARIKLAEIYHISGDPQQAAQTWQSVLEDNSGQIQIYHNVASSMMERRVYSSAVEIYERSRKEFENPTLFTNEIANAYMQAGQFEKAVNEYYNVITESPQQMGFVQQRFLRMRDDALYNVATLELEDYLLELDIDHPAYSQLYQLLSWLFLETEEYRRAFIFARQYESRTEQTNYSLFSLANRLRSTRQFEIAADAYNYYIESESGLVTRATEEKAITFLQWARYLDQQGLGTFLQKDELYRKAYQLNSSIIKSAPNYNRKERVLTNLIDLSLDHFKELEKAERWYNELNSYTEIQNSAKAYTLYAEGRIALFNGDYSTARQSLTRADRATEESNLSEKTRYYLSLSDFYAGDFEFAEVQLKSLERRNTSYFANNAIQLRMWIKNGVRMDSTATGLREFSNTLQLLHVGQYEEAVETAGVILEGTAHPYADDLIIEFANTLPHSFHPFVLTHLQNHVANNKQSPVRERLMWERAAIAEQMLTLRESGDDALTDEEKTFMPDTAELINETAIEEMYEEILLEFPGGFYAHYAREKLQQTPAQTL